MNEGVEIVAEMHRTLWDQFRGSFDDLTDEEIHWRVLPQANSINLIVRHLRIESEWHLRSIQSGAPMPTIAARVSQEAIDPFRSISPRISTRSSASTLRFAAPLERNRWEP